MKLSHYVYTFMIISSFYQTSFSMNFYEQSEWKKFNPQKKTDFDDQLPYFICTFNECANRFIENLTLKNISRFNVDVWDNLADKLSCKSFDLTKKAFSKLSQNYTIEYLIGYQPKNGYILTIKSQSHSWFIPKKHTSGIKILQKIMAKNSSYSKHVLNVIRCPHVILSANNQQLINIKTIQKYLDTQLLKK